MSSLEHELKILILRESDKEDLPLALDDWQDDEALFGEQSRIGLDSMDALQISVALQARYGIRLQGDRMVRKHLRSIATLAAHIRSHGDT